ncbi:MAG: peptidoglycan DD-metalloendopeptidase family protein [Alistipes sp.]
MKILSIVLFTFTLLCSIPAFAQETNEDQIAKQKRVIDALEQRIANEEQKIASIKKGRASAEETARRLARQVEARNELLAASKKQERLLMDEIDQTDHVASGLSASLLLHKAQYAEMVREAYRNYKHNNYLTYLFAARDFTDVARKIANLRGVAALRTHQMRVIDSLSGKVSIEQRVLAQRKVELDSLRRNLAAQKERLQRDANRAKANARQLSKKEQARLRQKAAQEQQLSVAISELRKLTKGNKEGASFTNKTSNLRLPVVNGRIKRYRGNMAEITGPQGARIISIYEGKVVDIKRNRITNKYDIYIAHGGYITSYANLSSTSVAKGQKVNRDQAIGIIGSSVDILTMETEYRLIFGIYAPTPDETMSAANCFKK